MQKIIVYCLPFAGGNQYSYHSLENCNSDLVNLVPLELPGRGNRVREAPLRDVHNMAADLFDQIHQELPPQYAIYGHSMGSLVGYLLARKIIQMGLQAPQHLFFSGPHEPARPLVIPPRHLLSQKDFVQQLIDLGGSPEEVLKDPDLLSFYEPLLRADFEATDTYVYEAGEPLQVPMTIMVGKDEGITMEQAVTWRDETTAAVDIMYFPGNHFFIFHHAQEIVRTMEQALRPVTV
jgi:surfactin synthase thioesterase subunit